MKQSLIIASEQSKYLAMEAIKNIDINHPMTVTIAPYSKRRTSEQNSMQWAGMLGDFAAQARLAGRLFRADVWHEYLKEKLLPDAPKEGVTLKGYKKWLEMPDGRLKMIGSTTMLTTRGMSDYLEQCYAFGCDLDVKFTTVKYG